MLTLYSLGVVLLAIIDQLSKWAVLRFVKPTDTIPLIQSVFHLTYCENRGAAFGILQGRFGFLSIITVAVIVVATIYMIKKRPQGFVMNASITLLIGGALGNLIDRVCRGYVIDFLDFRLIHFPIFNLADCFVVCGAILLIIYVLFIEEHADVDKKDSE
ncbi:MAG: signal peptidase II [Ruminococcaceae bacterium]|nr:signal peptidase II [Oscillospiraceae bacterium]